MRMRMHRIESVFFTLLVLFVSNVAWTVPFEWSRIPGVKVGKMTGEQKKKTEGIARRLKNTRGCQGTIADCASKGDITARRHVGFIARMVLKGKGEKDIGKGIANRKSSAFSDDIYKIDLAGHPYSGNPKAKVVVVEYACFQCPFCAHLAPKLRKLKKKYGDKLAYYYKFFPVRSHPRGVAAALAGFAAFKQGKFWAMYDLMFQNRAHLEDDDLQKYAREVGLDTGRFKADMKSKEAMRFIERDKLEGMRFGVEGTPTFFVNGKEFKGIQGFDEIVDRIDEEFDIVNGLIK